MKKLIVIMSLALFANVASAFTAGYNVGFNSKLVEQGVVTGTSLVTAGANVEVGSFGVAVDSFSSFDDNAGLPGVKVSDGWFKRVDLTASYKFTSTLADVVVGAKYKNAKVPFSLGGVKENLLPFVTVGGKAFTVLPWHITATHDNKNDNTNVEGNIEWPVPVNVGKLKVVTLLGGGINSGDAAVAALRAADYYLQGAVGLAYPTPVGTIRVDGFVQNRNLHLKNEVWGWRGGISYQF